MNLKCVIKQFQIILAVKILVILHCHLCKGDRISLIPNVFVKPQVPSTYRLHPETIDLLQASSQDPEVRPGLFQGDMALDDQTFKFWRVGLNFDIFPMKLWPNRTVPYHISDLYEPSDYVTIYKAIRTFNFMTCLKFIPWDGKAKDYLLIWPVKYPAGCWSFVGKLGGVQMLSLQPPNDRSPNCLGNEARAIHEIMHAIGIFHEQARPDRDRYVTIHDENIVPAFKGNFIKQEKANTTVSFEYDYDSIMHYGTDYFTKQRGKPTITPKMKGAMIGQRKKLSKLDCLKINDLYGCLENPKLSKKYYTLCRTLGL